uniref:Uncharacterized protein n=1 Tax=Anopheles stephensi TaxID=30069 RepID=A0A182Y8C6_ANOST
MKVLCSLVLLAVVGLAVAYPAEQVADSQPPADVVQLVPVEDSATIVPEALETVDGQQRSKRHLGFGGVGIGVGVGFVGGGVGGFGGYPGYGYGGGFHPGYGYGGFHPGFGYGGYRRYGYRYGGYGYGGGFGYPHYF